MLVGVVVALAVTLAVTLAVGMAAMDTNVATELVVPHPASPAHAHSARSVARGILPTLLVNGTLLVNVMLLILAMSIQVRVRSPFPWLPVPTADIVDAYWLVWRYSLSGTMRRASQPRITTRQKAQRSQQEGRVALREPDGLARVFRLRVQERAGVRQECHTGFQKSLLVSGVYAAVLCPGHSWPGAIGDNCKRVSIALN